MQQRAAARPILVASTLTLLLRLAYWAFAALLMPSLTLDETLIRSNRLSDHLMTPSAGTAYTLLGVWERFDTLWYLRIAAQGYDRPESVVFYPLYPALIRVLSFSGISPLTAALAISTISSCALFCGLLKLLRLDLPNAVATRSVILLAVWPGSFILLAGYPDSLVIALIVWSIYFARQERFWLAGTLGFLAASAKAVGALAIVPLALLAWRKRRWRAAGPIALCLLSPLLFQLHVQLAGYGSTSLVYARYWKTAMVWPWTTLYASALGALAPGTLLLKLNLGALLLICALILWKRLRPEYSLYAIAALILFLTKKTDPLLQSTMRYVLAVFPAYAGLACLLNRWVLVAAVDVALFGVNLILLRRYFQWSLVV